MPTNETTDEATAGSPTADCSLRCLPPQPVATTRATIAGNQAYRSYACRTLNPQNDTSRASTAIIAMPTSAVILPPDTADRVCPPTTHIMTQNPVSVARFNSTGIDTM